MDDLYGCHNKERAAGYWLQERSYDHTRRYILADRYIADQSSRECRYDQRAKDQRCTGCGK